jgi:chromosome segregation ATPase
MLTSLRTLGKWYEEANQLERQIAHLSSKVQENDRRLVAAQRQSKESRARKVQAADSIPRIYRARKEIEARHAGVKAALKAEQEKCARSKKDNVGLGRSLKRLQERLGSTVLTAGEIEEQARLEMEVEEFAHVEEATLLATIDSMAQVQKRLTDQVASERQKRHDLRVAARAKLDRVEQGKTGLTEQVKEHEAAVAKMKERLQEQEARTEAAERELMFSRELARRAGICVEQQQEARRAMHSELLGVQRTHESLRADLEVTLDKLEYVSERESKAQAKWRLQHMEKLDSRIHAQRELDQDVVVAEAPHLSARAGGG